MAGRWCGGLVGANLLLSMLLAQAVAEEATPRPAMSIVQAHAKVFQGLKPEGAKQFYCLKAFSGDMLTKDGKVLVWRFHLANDAGIRFTVILRRDGEVQLNVQPDSPPPQLHPGVKSLTDLESVIASYGKLPKGAEIEQGDSIVVKYKTRKFVVHDVEASGEYANTAREVVGPEPEGFVMRVREVKRGEVSGLGLFDRPLYWSTSRRFFPGFTSDSELVVEIDYGKGWQALDMFRAVGTNGCEHPAPARPALLLPEACELALASLSEQEREQFYVLSASSRQAGKSPVVGEWHIRLGAANGDRIHISLDRDGKVVRSLRESPYKEAKGQTKIMSLADAEKMIPDLLKALGVEGTVTHAENKLIVESATRSFQVHREIEPQVFANDAQQVKGPAADGFILTLEEVDLAGELKTRLEGPAYGLPGTLEFGMRGYFVRSKVACRTADADRVLIVETLLGRKSAIEQMLYERFERWEQRKFGSADDE